MELAPEILLVSLVMPLGSIAGPFFPLNVPPYHNFGYLNFEDTFGQTQFQSGPRDVLEERSTLSTPVCISESCILSAADLLKQMDRDVDPCEDFFRFACGGFINDVVLPEHKTRTGFIFTFPLETFSFTILGSFSKLGDQLNERLKKVFEAEPVAAEPNIYKGICKKCYLVYSMHFPDMFFTTSPLHCD